MPATLLSAQFHLSFLYTEILVVAADFLGALIEHDEVMNEVVEESLLLEHTEKLPVQFIRQSGALFKNIYRDLVKRLRAVLTLSFFHSR